MGDFRLIGENDRYGRFPESNAWRGPFYFGEISRYPPTGITPRIGNIPRMRAREGDVARPNRLSVGARSTHSAGLLALAQHIQPRAHKKPPRARRARFTLVGIQKAIWAPPPLRFPGFPGVISPGVNMADKITRAPPMLARGTLITRRI